jgi:tetrahydromethanopterin S-methyltransferase subunit H
MLLNVDGMSPETLARYLAYLIEIRVDPMSCDETEAYRKHREVVATRLAFPSSAEATDVAAASK